MNLWRWLKGVLFTGTDIKPGHEPSFNFDPAPDYPVIPIDPETDRPGQPNSWEKKP